MDQFTNILLQLDETRTVLSELETAVRQQHEVTPAITANIRSLHKRHRQLEEEFSLMTHENYLDVCTYRIFAENDGKRPNIAAVARTLTDFQSLFTVVYDSLKNGPKERVSYTDEIESESAFEFGYSFTGSVGFVLTMPNERLLFGESDLDRSMKTIFEIVKSTTTEQIQGLARQVGIASVRKAYKWVEDHLDASLNADIRWCRNKEIRANVVVEIPELRKLQSIIDQTSDEAITEMEVECTFRGGDLDSRTFHIESESQGSFRGRMAERADKEVKPTLGGKYIATLRRTSVVHYSTEKEDVSYILLALHKVAR